ncbi:MAG: hypothetical protein JW854_08690 [Actinobacteria bacterium]|nr:hypothetical protein [Actinomycetota bacterium]
MDAKLCQGCGVPRRITKEHIWLGNGLIVERKNPEQRMLFFESENIAGLFRNIEEIIGLDIEHIIMESQHRSTYEYVTNLVPPLVRKVVSHVGLKQLTRNLLKLSALMGQGCGTLTSLKIKGSEDDHVAIAIRNPWFLPSNCGLISGGLEALTGLESRASYEEISPGEYLITARISSQPKELEGRLQKRSYPRKEGDLELKRCAFCGGPQDLASFSWNACEGIIETESSGRRMVLMGPGEFEPVFEELRNELGEHVTRVIMEAQRLFVTEGFYSREDIRQEKDLVHHFALRGLGNLREIDLAENRLSARLENPCMHMMMVGLLLGFYELIFGRKGEAAWEIDLDGDLVVEVSSG